MKLILASERTAFKETVKKYQIIAISNLSCGCQGLTYFTAGVYLYQGFI